MFAEGSQKAVLQITFREQPGWQVGYPEDGVIWSTADAKSYNLNRPAVISALIKFMLQSQWDPDGVGGAVEVADGIPLFSSSGAPEGAG